MRPSSVGAERDKRQRAGPGRELDLFAAPEGAACLVAYRELRGQGFFKGDDTVVLFNTGSGLKYLDVLDSSTSRTATRPMAAAKPAARQIGGIIGPY